MNVAVSPSWPCSDPGDREVLNVLGEGETGSRDTGIHHAVRDPVELATGKAPDQEDEQALGGLLYDGGDENGCESEGFVGGDGSPQDELAGRVEGHRDEDGDEGSPEEGHDEVAGGLGLEAVEPHERRDDDAERDDRDDEPEQRGTHSGGSADGHGDGQGGESEAEDRDPEEDPATQQRPAAVRARALASRLRWLG